MKETNSKNIGAVILAAGASSRMGAPKQLMKYAGETLVRRAAGAAREAGCHPVVVVTGAYADLVTDELRGLDLRTAHNPEWESGMGSSIRAGFRAIAETSNQVAAVIIMLCDQPFVTRDVLSGLILAQRGSGSAIVASSYGSTVGVPALFGREFFGELLELEGESGAKQIIQKHSDRVQVLPFPQGEMDLDTPADFGRLLAVKRS